MAKKENLLDSVCDVLLSIDKTTKEIVQYKYQMSNGEIVDGIKQRKRKKKEITQQGLENE